MRHHSPQRGSGEALSTGRLEADWGSTFPHGARRRRFSRRDGAGAGAPDEHNHKTMQLCRQVAVTLDEVLAECGDPLLQGLRVLNVVPAPDVSRLRVTLAADGEPAETLPLVEDHLARASAHLRGEVAQAITRKRAPSLVYFIAPGETGA